MKNYKFDIVGSFKKVLLISMALFVAIIGGIFIRGVELDIQFKGGTILTYSYTGELHTDEVANKVNEFNLGNTTVTEANEVASSEDEKSLKVSITSQGLTPDQLSEVNKALGETFKDNNIKQMNISNVSPTIGKDFFAKSLVSIGFASVLMILYIAFRFRKIGGFSAGVMAIVALVHDIIIVFGVFVLLGFTIDNNFIAVVLTILGYSVNDTIVIYDRIRENRDIHGNKISYKDLVNLSINQSLTRTINTTVTTVLALSAVCIVAVVSNVHSIITFAFPMIIGMVSGVYSSLFIAGPLWVKWQERKEK